MPVATCLPHLECPFRTVHLDVLAVSVRLLPGTRPRQDHSLSWVGGAGPVEAQDRGVVAQVRRWHRAPRRPARAPGPGENPRRSRRGLLHDSKSGETQHHRCGATSVCCRHLARGAGEQAKTIAELGEQLWSRLGSNQRPSACEADALPLSHGTAPRGERGGRLARSAGTPNSAHARERGARWRRPERAKKFVCARSRRLSSCFAPGDDLVRCARMWRSW
jgi:hypothetical protein